MSTCIFRYVFWMLIFVLAGADAKSQCITTFPYVQDFESSEGGWNTGGAGSSWEWGVVAKPVITSAASGLRCWTTGGITGSSYSNSEASFVQSPCFDFTNLKYPYVSMKVFWETELVYDGAAFQYSDDGGVTWLTVGTASSDCINQNWYNQGAVTYLTPFTQARQGWSGNGNAAGGSCGNGGGSKQWVFSSHTIPSLAGKPRVLFRFIFGAGTLCNNYDGFAFDDFSITEAPTGTGMINSTCISNSTVSFTASADLCYTDYDWNFGDAGSGNNNQSKDASPKHTYTSPGEYTLTLTLSKTGLQPLVLTKKVSVIKATASVVAVATCPGDRGGGAATVQVNGPAGPYTYLWSTNPAQTTVTATGLNAGNYSVVVTSANACGDTAAIQMPVDLSCIGIYFPSAFTPNNDRVNDSFGPLGGINYLSNYQLRIYNRWGELVFYSENPLEKWDGWLKGKKAVAGQYIWTARFSVYNQPVETRRGNIMLME